MQSFLLCTNRTFSFCRDITDYFLDIDRWQGETLHREVLFEFRSRSRTRVGPAQKPLRSLG